MFWRHPLGAGDSEREKCGRVRRGPDETGDRDGTAAWPARRNVRRHPKHPIAGYHVIHKHG
jgi:hypothetical protein